MAAVVHYFRLAAIFFAEIRGKAEKYLIFAEERWLDDAWLVKT